MTDNTMGISDEGISDTVLILAGEVLPKIIERADDDLEIVALVLVEMLSDLSERADDPAMARQAMLTVLTERLAFSEQAVAAA